MTEDRDYLHGYNETERARLVSQSLFLEPWIFARVDYSGRQRLLEVGCGVGAQLKILARRFPELELTGIDLVASQVDAARINLASEIKGGSVRLVVGDGGKLPFGDKTFDAGFLCWVLEHAPERAALLADFRRVLTPQAILYGTEVFLATLYLSPRAPSIMRYWSIFQDFQESIGGDPQAGARLGGWLDQAGFARIETYPLTITLDRRDRDAAHRARFWDYWQELLASGEDGLLKAGQIDRALIAGVAADFARLRGDPDAVFHIAAMQARAVAPG